MPTVQFTMRVDAELKAAIEDEAQRQDLSASQVATRAIRSHLTARAAERAAIEAAIANADKGEFISKDAMMAWVESWDTPDEQPAPKSDMKI